MMVVVLSTRRLHLHPLHVRTLSAALPEVPLSATLLPLARLHPTQQQLLIVQLFRMQMLHHGRQPILLLLQLDL